MIYLIDSGHGGIINGVYQTPEEKEKYHTFSNKETAYEGVLNRQIKSYVLELFEKKGLKVIDICPSLLDIELDERVDISNIYCREYGANNCLLISLHSNKGRGTGFEIWTSEGQTKSDRYATMFGEIFMAEFPEVRFRSDTKEGDIPKDAAFYILKWTKCPAILPEFLFYDNWKDYQMLKDPIVQKKYANMIFDFAKRCEITPV